jgi:hypothetical protein
MVAACPASLPWSRTLLTFFHLSGAAFTQARNVLLKSAAANTKI